MKFIQTYISAAVVSVAMGSNAHAALSSANTLSIENDAVAAYVPETNAYVIASNGADPDSFFTVDGVQGIQKHFAFLEGNSALTLGGAPQANVASFVFFDVPGSFETIGTGISIVSANGDTATVDMSGLVMDWVYTQDIALNTGAWGPGYANGRGYVTCATGSGCTPGSAYTLQYASTIATSHPSGLGDVKVYLELHGTVGLVPEASTYGMMLAGLLPVWLSTRRRDAEGNRHSCFLKGNTKN